MHQGTGFRTDGRGLSRVGGPGEAGSGRFRRGSASATRTRGPGLAAASAGVRRPRHPSQPRRCPRPGSGGGGRGGSGAGGALRCGGWRRRSWPPAVRMGRRVLASGVARSRGARARPCAISAGGADGWVRDLKGRATPQVGSTSGLRTPGAGGSLSRPEQEPKPLVEHVGLERPSRDARSLPAPRGRAGATRDEASKAGSGCITGSRCSMPARLKVAACVPRTT
jgi:hypothetical protein